MRILKEVIKTITIFLIGGISYYLIEVLWRGYSHVSMAILGGICFVLIGLVSMKYSTGKNNILKQLIISSLIITTLELIFGLVLNVKLGLGIWDYSHFRFHFMGQISLVFTIIWFLLSLPAIILYKFIRLWLFGEGENIETIYLHEK